MMACGGGADSAFVEETRLDRCPLSVSRLKIDGLFVGKPLFELTSFTTSGASLAGLMTGSSINGGEVMVLDVRGGGGGGVCGATETGCSAALT